EPRLGAREGAVVGTGCRGIHEYQSTHFGRMALGVGERDRTAIGVAYQDWTAEVKPFDHFVDRLELAVEGEVATGREAIAGPVDRDRAVTDQRRDVFKVFGCAGQPVDQENRRFRTR